MPSRAQRRRRTIRRRRAVAVSLLVLLVAGVSVAASDEDRQRARRGAASAVSGPPGQQAPHPPGTRAGARLGSATAWLAPGSDPSVLPGPVLIADRDNNRLLEVDPRGRIIWRFPAPGDLASGQTFRVPDDAFFSPDGRRVIATQEDDQVISVIDPAGGRIVYRYGHPGEAGVEAGYAHNPDDALLMPSGDILTADIMNCRLLVIRPPRHRPLWQLGATGTCEHRPGVSFGSPNGAFPAAGSRTVVTEINGNWVDVLAPNGRTLLSVHPPRFSYPSDTNELRPGVLLSVDYESPGAIETFTSTGRLLWRYAPGGARALDHPSLALPLPNGDVLANDDRNHRVIVVDPRTNRVVWQYGHTGVAGSSPGYLSNPDGVDLTPPYSLAMRFAGTMTAPAPLR
ncbi:MAG TPA: PQQ-binding-like beta-propeller repeat protein [Solirubrobacteraceae bacterium]|nr:PQQ-binding-like beta-propeller repeat protein [Solirubrobacteraceae bacterium]